jgi:hypothetical protein
MKKNILQQEILLVTNTRFFQKQLCERIGCENRYTSNIERLEGACWNGLLDDWFPEIMKRSTTGKSLCLAHIQPVSPFLKIVLSESISLFDKSFSIDPCQFLPEIMFTN